MTENKKRYREIIDNASIPLFLQPDWLDLVAPKWEVELYIENNKMMAALPFCVKGNAITKRIYIPEINFYQSLIFFEENISTDKKNAIALALFSKLNHYIKAHFKFTPEHTDIDISSLKYKKEVYTTHSIDTIFLEENMSSTHKRNIQKANREQYSIRESTAIRNSFGVIESTFKRKNIKSTIDYATFEKLHHYCSKTNSGKVLDCVTPNNALLASVFYVEDDMALYYLCSGYDVSFKNTGAVHFVLFYLIKRAIEKNKVFHFCGSRIKSIADFFKGFGAKEQAMHLWKKSIL